MKKKKIKEKRTKKKKKLVYEPRLFSYSYISLPFVVQSGILIVLNCRWIMAFRNGQKNYVAFQ